MKLQLSNRGYVNSIAEIISTHARKLINKKNEIIYMNIGQPSTGVPQIAIKKLNDYSQNNILGYTPVTGLPILKKKISQHYKDNYGVTIDESRIIITFGASCAIILAILSLFDYNQNIVIPLPCYPAYYHTIKIHGVNPILIETQLKNNYQIQISQLDKLKKINGLIVTSPGNPTGSIIDPIELKKLITYCRKNKIIFISDEIYHGISFNKNLRPETALSFSNNVIVVNSFSKYYSAPGWRCGWMVVPENLVKSISHIARNLYVSPNAPSQIIAYECFNCIKELDKNIHRYRKNREILLEEMPKAGFIDAASPDGAFYYYAKAKGIKNSLNFCIEMMNSIGVVASPGIDFDPINGKDYIRFSYAGSTRDIEIAVKRLKKWRKNI